jgi:hypothetical protein
MSTTATRLMLAVLVARGVAVGMTTTGCYMGPHGVEVGADFDVDGPPPALQDDVVVAAPGPDYIWVGGHYEWGVSAKSYQWRTGAWVHPPHAGATWVAPRYEERGGRRIYHSGHWQR